MPIFKTSYHFEVAGISHYWENINKVWDGDGECSRPIALIPEPDNPKDKNAIRVEVYDKIIGYVPAKKAEKVLGILRQHVYEQKVNFERNGDNSVSVVVWMWYRRH